VGAGQISQTHQEFADDLAAGEFECLAEELHPGGFVARVMSVEPRFEGAITALDFPDLTGVGDRRGDFEAIADNAGISQQPRDIALIEFRDPVDIPASIGGGEVCPLFQDRQPGQAGLVDFEDQPLEEN